MAAPVGTYTNNDLLFEGGTNTDTVALNQFYVFATDNRDANGAVTLGHANAGGILGCLETVGMTAGNFVADTSLPVGQSGRFRKRGIGKARAAAVTCVVGSTAYALPAGNITNVSNSGANKVVGIFASATTGTLDELVLVDFQIR